MRWRQARKHGVTIFSLRRAALAAREHGHECTAECIMEELLEDSSFKGDGVDWDSLLDFIERVLPLILKLISLFG